MATNSKKDTMKKIALGLVGVLSVAALATSVTSLVMGAQKNGWFDSEEASTASVDTSGFQVGDIENGNGISLMSMVKTSTNEGSVLLTATITPEDAEDKTVSWGIAWADESSAWADGKTVTDYVTVTPSSAGSLTATVACLQDFGEQVVVTVTSTVNEEATASATFDYAKRIESVEISLSGDATVDNTNMKATVYSRSPNAITFTPVYSDYTIDDDYTISYEAQLTSAAVTALTAQGLTVSSDAETPVTIGDDYDATYLSATGMSRSSSAIGMFYGGVGSTYNSWVNVVDALDNAVYLTLTVSYAGTYSSVDASFDIVFSNDAYALTAESAELDVTNYIF